MLLRPVLVLLAVSAAACQNATAPASQAQAHLEALLPRESAYITGTVIERGNRLGQDPSVLVATNPRNPLADPSERRGDRSAHVVLSGDVVVVRRDGRSAGVNNLQPGRVVMVWVGSTELRSLPPVVFGRVLVIEP